MGEKVAYCSSLDELPKIAPIAEAAFNGDPTANEVYRVCSEYLGRGLQ